MQFKQGARVNTMEGEEAGHIDRIVIDPKTDEITHVVIEQGFLKPHNKVVPIEAISVGPTGDLTVRMNPDQFDALPEFAEKYYVLVDEHPDSGLTEMTFWYPQFAGGAPVMPVPTGPQYVQETRLNVPADTVPVKEGARVIARDGEEVGRVDQVLTGVQKDLITHLLVARGLLTQEKRLIPVSWVESYDEEEVHLAVQSDVVERLPLRDLNP